MPLFGAPITSVMAIILAALVQRTGCGIVVVLLLGIAVPLAALVIVWIGSAIGRALYIEPEGEPPDSQHATPILQAET